MGFSLAAGIFTALIMDLQIPKIVWDDMFQHVSSETPLEACGLLAGTNKRVEKIYRVRNALQSKVRFRMDAREQLAAFENAEAAGLEILAIYHSHPQGPSAPSLTDLAEAAYPVISIIWSGANGKWQGQGFWLEGNNARPASLEIVD